ARVMHEAGVKVEGMTAAIGPGISAEHFEVGEEVAAEFVRQGLEVAVQKAGRKWQKPHVDLELAVLRQLEKLGLRKIDANGGCTFRDADDFYSHRREHGVTGRMAGVIAARG
ncbi:MAG TPA: polyphenol oxidase family protein, partial [Phycisphaerae bacterium]